MKINKLVLAACAAGLLFTACGDSSTPERAGNAAATPAATVAQSTPAPAAAPDELTQARTDYGNFCIKCHKQDGTGGRVELEDGKTLKVDNLREHGLRDSDEELAEQIREGGDGMPAFGDRLDAKRIGGLVKFVRVEFHGRAAAAGSPAAPAR